METIDVEERTNNGTVDHSPIEREWWENDYSIRPNYTVPSWMHNTVLFMIIVIFVSGVSCNLR